MLRKRGASTARTRDRSCFQSQRPKWTETHSASLCRARRYIADGLGRHGDDEKRRKSRETNPEHRARPIGNRNSELRLPSSGASADARREDIDQRIDTVSNATWL